MKFDPIEAWLANVAYSHSGSISTDKEYRRELKKFLEFIDMSAEQILSDYEASSDRLFRRKYAQYIRAWIASLGKKDYTKGTVAVSVAAVSSFFKYNDLPLGHIPMARNTTVYHNRDLTREEITDILSISNPRNRAFFAVMTQSGLRPYTICLLQVKHLEPNLSEGKIPCKIEVPAEIAKGKVRSHFTFIGEEAVRYLTDYLKTRPNLTPGSYLFTQHGKEKRVFTRDVSHRFRDAALKLKKKGLLDFEQKAEGKPSEVRLYNLRKFFRNCAGQAGVDYVNFWMGHSANYKASHIPASDEHYFSRQDVEFHRKLYAGKAMPFLRLETATPTETEKKIAELEAEVKELRAFRKFMERKQAYVYIPDDLHGEERLKALTKLVQNIMSDIEQIKKAGKDFWERSDEIQDKAKKREKH